MARSKDISVEALRHKDKRRNIPTAELEPVMDEKDKTPIRLAYERRNRDLDPQLVWRGKDEQDWSDLIVQAPPLYIQEKVHPKVLIDDLLRQSKMRREEASPPMPDLFADFNGLPDKEALTEFYRHDANWSNRMILGDSLSVMASLAEREGLRGKVQCIYIDPPYGIRFNSNFQWSTTSRDVKDRNKDHITREPEQVKAFRDTWRDGIHSDLTYLRDRLTVARDLLADSGSIFVQIGDENVHRVRALMDEVFGDENFVGQVYFNATSGRQDATIDRLGNYVLWYARDYDRVKYRQIFIDKSELETESASDLQSQGIRTTGSFEVRAFGRKYVPLAGNHWKATEDGVRRLLAADRVKPMRQVIRYRRLPGDFPVIAMGDVWTDTGGGAGQDKIYVVLPHAEERPQGASRSTHGSAAAWEEWEIPREAGADWPAEAKALHAEWWAGRIARQKEIDASIAAKAEFEYLYDKPYPDNSRIRVAGPFTVESLSPHRVMAVDEDDSLIDTLDLADPGASWNDFAQIVLDNLKTSGVQQAHKEDRTAFTALTPWPGNLVCAEGRYLEGDRERRAAIFLGPEFGTVARADLGDEVMKVFPVR